jgi:hypothetical protein
VSIPAQEPIELTDSDWSTIRGALAFKYEQKKRAIRRANKRVALGKTPIQRPSELAMELADLFEVYRRVRALHPPPPLPPKIGRAK